MYENLTVWKETMLKKASQQLTLGDPDQCSDKVILNNFLDFGICEIRKRRKLSNDTEFLRGYHDYTLTRFIVRSYNEGGIEGAGSASSLGNSTSFTLSPIAELQSNTLQII